MFETFIVQPIFNLLVLIYAIVPGHDFGIAVILFTIVVRMMLWPLLKKQLHQTKKMRDLQPAIKKIREKTKGDRQREAELLMELYKEKGVNPVGSIGILIIQLPILLGLFQGLRRLAENKEVILELSYSWVQNIGWMKEVVADINNFDETLFGVVDLTRSAFGETLYIPVLIIAITAGVLQFFQTRQLSPDTGDSRSIRQILKDEANGKRADQAEINAAMGRNMRFIFPFFTFFISASLPGALALYWATGSAVGIFQQRKILNTDVEEMEEVADKLETKVTTIEDKPKTKSAQSKPKKKTKQGKSKKAAKRRRR